MNITSLLMLVVGAVLGIGIGYVTFSSKPAEPEHIIQAERFHKIDMVGNMVDITVVKRIDADNLEIIKNIQMPIEGFAKSYTAMESLAKTLIQKGILAPTSEANSPQE